VEVRMALGVGARGILVTTGHGERDYEKMGRALPEGTLVAADLTEAVAEVLIR
jgi:hypothetical protein